MNTNQLRQKILDLAISGKLVPQDPNDEPASVILEQINNAKGRLAKTGKNNRTNKQHTPSIEHDATPPDGWAWCQLSQIASFSGGKTPSTSNSDYWNGSVNWTTSKDMKAKYIDSTITKMSDIGAEQMQLFPPKTLVMVVRSGILRRTLPIAILRQNSTVNQDIKTISFYVDDVCEYVYAFFRANEQGILTNYSKSGTTVESINFDELKEIQIPFPPPAEQRRIVAAIDSAFEIIDEIERNKTDLQATVTAAKQKILSLAIQGKLVPQDPNDESAEHLLQRVLSAKASLSGKVKTKSKNDDDASKAIHERYAELPRNWVLTSLGEVFNLQAGKFISASSIASDDSCFKYPCYGGNGQRGYVENHNRNGEYPLIGRQGALCGNLNYATGHFYATEHAVVVETFAETNPRWAYWFLKELNLNQYATATAQPGLSVNKINEVPIPLPPLAEQRRIVSAIEEALEQLNEIAKNLT